MLKRCFKIMTRYFDNYGGKVIINNEKLWSIVVDMDETLTAISEKIMQQLESVLSTSIRSLKGQGQGS